MSVFQLTLQVTVSFEKILTNIHRFFLLKLGASKPFPSTRKSFSMKNNEHFIHSLKKEFMKNITHLFFVYV